LWRWGKSNTSDEKRCAQIFPLLPYSRSVIGPFLYLCRRTRGLGGPIWRPRRGPIATFSKFGCSCPVKNQRCKPDCCGNMYDSGHVLLSLFCACHMFDGMNNPHDSIIQLGSLMHCAQLAGLLHLFVVT
jgi:hypothetical protein